MRESQTHKIAKVENTYPKSIAFIISNEFCERFNYYGMRTILVLYLTTKLGYNENSATILFHLFTVLVYFFPILGAILADSVLGKFRTILYLSCVYAIGSVVISLGAIPILNLPASTFTLIGLLLIGFGSGGIKPCVSAFGGDQFKLPEQAKQIATFFSLFYFAINAGSLISTSLTPILREDVHCFGDETCFSLAFGLPAVLMVISVIVFVIGKSLYTIKEPTGNVVVLVSKCIVNAISTKSKQTNLKLEHWLDYSEPKFGRQLVQDIKGLMKILVLFIPLPFFWALFDQQGSRWTFQATRMTGDVGSFTIKPDQMQVINPFLILLFIPVFDYFVYPALAKVGIKRPLQKLTLGGILAGVAFMISGLVELQLEKTYAVVPGVHESQLRVFNGLDCQFEFTTDIAAHSKFTIKSLEEFEERHVKLDKNSSYKFEVTSKSTGCKPSISGWNFNLRPESSVSYYIYGTKDAPQFYEFTDKVDKSSNGDPIVRLLVNLPTASSISFKVNKTGEMRVFNSTDRELHNLWPATYSVSVGNTTIQPISLQLGGVYTLVLGAVNGKPDIKMHTIASPNSIHMFWLLPQYVVITAAEIMFSVTGLEFSYSQAPSSMKSVLQACWLLTVAFGNVIVVVIAEARIFKSQAYEFFLFMALMFVDMGIFILLAMRYKYVSQEEDKPMEAIDEPARGTQVSESEKNTFTNVAFQND